MNYGDPFRIRSRESFSAEERNKTFPIFECFPCESKKFDFLIFYRIELREKLFGGIFFMKIHSARGKRKEREIKITVHLFNIEI